MGLFTKLFLTSLVYLCLSPYGTSALSVKSIDECPPLAPRDSPATHIRDLRADDVDVIMGIGDSLMSGLNSRIPHLSPVAGLPSEVKKPEFRGGAFISGADDDATSVGSIMSKYNPSISGLSRGNASMIYCYGPICPAGSKFVPFEPETTGLNAAQSGAWTTLQNTFNQLKYLGCVDWARNNFFSADHYEEHIRGLVDGIRLRYTKTFVVLMGPFNMSQLHGVIDTHEGCRIKRNSLVGCLCNDRPNLFNDSRLEMDLMSTEYNVRLAKIAQEYQASNFSDFTVVHDPGLGRLDFRNGSIDMISGADCFHPSQQSHNRAGVSVWNNLFLPYQKKRPLNIKTPNLIDCPDEESRIWSG